MTGLTRKEVRRLRDKADTGDESDVSRQTALGVILHRWFTEPDFVSETGEPRALRYDEGDCSFTELVRRYGGDIPPGAMRTELKRIGVAKELPNGKLQAVRRNVSRPEIHERLIDGLSIVVYPAILALANNTKLEEESETWVMRTAATSRVREGDIPRLRRIGSDRLAEFVESIDDLFVAYETLHDDDPSESSDRAIGIGVYYFEEEKEGSTHFHKA